MARLWHKPLRYEGWYFLFDINSIFSLSLLRILLNFKLDLTLPTEINFVIWFFIQQTYLFCSCFLVFFKLLLCFHILEDFLSAKSRTLISSLYCIIFLNSLSQSKICSDCPLHGKPVPVFNYSYCKDFFFNVQSKFSFLKVVHFAFCSLAVHTWVESGTVFSRTNHLINEKYS